MNILQVLSQFEVTGAETFAATLADTQIADGHTVYIISDNFYTPTKARVIAHPIGKRDLAQRKKNVEFLKNFIREKKIDVVHAHSRAASWVSYFATRKGNVPLVSSIHGRQHLHFSSKIFSIYGEKRVAVCKSIYDHLNHDLKYELDTLSLVHNGIDLTKWEFKKHSPPKRKKKIVSFVGRLSGFKGDTLLVIVEKIFPEVLRQFPDVEFHIIGGMNEKSKIIPAIEQTNGRMGTEFIIAKGFSKDVESIYRDSDLIVGSGRVAMEALACGSPVVSIGESNYVGVISPETEREALVTNFGDLDARRPIDVDKSVAAILQILKDPKNFSGKWGREFIEKNFEITFVSEQMNRVYTEAVAKKKGITEIPVLSYQKVMNNEEYRSSVMLNPPDPARHPFLRDLHAVAAAVTGAQLFRVKEGSERIVGAFEFESQLAFLKTRGFTPLNFFEMKEIASFKKRLPDRPVILTFDADEENVKNASPLLKKFGFTGVFFVQSDVPRPNFRQAKELAEDGFEIGSASHSKPKMNLISDEEIHSEISGSKKLIEKGIGSKIITFAYPNGFVNEKLSSVIKESGYHFAVALDEGRRNFWINFFKVRRIQIFGGATIFSFWKKTSGRYLWYKYVY